MKPTAARMAQRVADTDDRRTCQSCGSLSGERCKSSQSDVLREWPRNALFRCRGFMTANSTQSTQAATK